MQKLVLVKTQYYSINLNDDKYFKVFLEDKVETGTWEKVNGKIVLRYADGSKSTCVLDGNLLIANEN